MLTRKCLREVRIDERLPGALQFEPRGRFRQVRA